MKEKTVIVEIDEQGNSSLDLEGFQGSGCCEVAKHFRARDAIQTIKNKREFYVQAVGRKLPQHQQ